MPSSVPGNDPYISSQCHPFKTFMARVWLVRVGHRICWWWRNTTLRHLNTVSFQSKASLPTTAIAYLHMLY
jgi:hypothetical protein